jgi:glucosamine kinase
MNATQSQTMPLFGLGLDAGGNATRWALVDDQGQLLQQGQAGPMSGLMIATPEGTAALHAVLSDIHLAQSHIQPLVARHVELGLNGLGDDPTQMQKLVSTALQVPQENVRVRPDIELAYHCAFKPGQGYLVYAGTGSVAAFIDDQGQFTRVGGRGVALDDAGAGFWIARAAMRLVWRREDERPGAWQHSALARAVFEHVGGSDWDHSKQFFYHQDRGTIGRLAIAVGQTADQDADAMFILMRAAEELARLGQVLITRFGERPIKVAGRVFDLHPILMQRMSALLNQPMPITRGAALPHVAAARMAVGICLH